MALDQNLFTLNLNRPSPEDTFDLDLVDPAGSLHYRKRRLPDPHSFGIYEPLSDSLLATVASSSNNKVKVLELYNPNVIIQLKYIGTLSFKWSFQWEDHSFEWKREQCFLIRKPDPPVLVAITKEPPGRIRTGLVQILDYNLMRFDIADRKGLEIVILTALLSFQDEEAPAPKPSPKPSTSSAPTPPPKPPSKPNETQKPVSQPLKPTTSSPEDQIAILQAKEARDANEVVVGEVGDIPDYATMCVNLLRDPSILFISIRSDSSPSTVPRVVAVADLTKRMAHRDEVFSDELHQYLSYNEVGNVNIQGDGKKKKVIKLDDEDSKKKKGKKEGGIRQEDYKPPENLTIRLSKIPMPELTPKAKHPQSSPTAYKPLSGQSPDPRNKASSNSLAPPPQPPRPSSTGPIPSSRTTKPSKPPRPSNSPPAHSRTTSSISMPLHSQASAPSPIPEQPSPLATTAPSNPNSHYPSWVPNQISQHLPNLQGQQQHSSQISGHSTNGAPNVPPSFGSVLGAAALNMLGSRSRQ